MSAAVALSTQEHDPAAATVDALMSQIEGRDHKLIAQVVDAKVDQLRDELKGHIADLGMDIKYSIGQLAGKLEGVQSERTEAAKHVQALATKLDQHIGAHADDDPKRPWWQNPRWLTSAAFLGLTLVSLALALGQELIGRALDLWFGGFNG